ncbi:MAG: virginiamycin B lyase family protein [Solirubrobacteraceae bacterium]
MPAALVVALALSGSTLAAPVGQITEFATATANAGPEGIAAGPDGNLWFPEAGADKIGEVNPTTGATADFAVPTAGSFPLGIALGPDGNLWFTEFAADKIGEINPVSHAISDFTIPTAASGPVAIVAGPNGNVWFTESGGAGQIGEINPATQAFTEFPVMTPNVQPFGIAVGPDGNIWFTEKDTGMANSRIGVMDPNTGTTSDFAITASSEPNAIATGPNGSLWITESAAGVSKVGLVNIAAKTVTAFGTGLSSPTVIVPGPDGNMWFTENGGAGHVADINPVTHDITEFATPTANSNPVGIATGSDGNLWFTEVAAAASKVGLAGAGAPGTVVTAPAVTGTPQPAQTLTCQGATWSSWAGQQPAFGFGFDGFRWLLDGGQIAGATGQTLVVPSADVGHQISCDEIATYPLVAATVSSASAAVTISPSLSASLVSTKTTPTTVTLTLSCQGLPSQRCTGTAKLTSHVTTRGSQLVAVAAKAKKKPKPKPKPPKKITKVETIASGSYSIPTGQSSTVALHLNATGKKLLTARYKVPATLTVTGTASAKKTVTFKYGVISLSPAYTWFFNKTYSYALELTVSHLPKGSKITLSCHGHGCPVARKTFSAPKNGKLALASALKKRHLTPHSTVTVQITAPNEVGEVVVFTIVSGKSPTETFLCLPPGAHAPSACAR